MKRAMIVNNSIYIMRIVAELYMAKYHMTQEDFLKFDNENRLLSFIAKCPEVFDGLPNEVMLKEAEEYVECQKCR